MNNEGKIEFIKFGEDSEAIGLLNKHRNKNLWIKIKQPFIIKS